MKMVIDVQENWETQILNMSDSEVVDFLYAIVCSGTPLPKGHGRLIDADAAKCSTCGKFGCENSELCELYKAKTIIEADGGAK